GVHLQLRRACRRAGSEGARALARRKQAALGARRDVWRGPRAHLAEAGRREYVRDAQARDELADARADAVRGGGAEQAAQGADRLLALLVLAQRADGRRDRASAKEVTRSCRSARMGQARELVARGLAAAGFSGADAAAARAWPRRGRARQGRARCLARRRSPTRRRRR